MIKDYESTYRKLGSKEFMTFYLGEYNMLRHEVWGKWKVPVIMMLLWVLDWVVDIQGIYYGMDEIEKSLLLVIGVVSTILVMNDKWYGALLYSILMGGFLLGRVGYIYDILMWIVAIIASTRAIMDLKQMDNLKTYYDMAKLTEWEKTENEE